MNPGRNHFRLFITALLAVVVPFCCCNLTSLLDEAGPFDVTSRASVRTAAARADTAEGVVQTMEACCKSKPRQSREHEQPAPEDSREKGKRDCLCCQAAGMMLTLKNTTLELSAPVVVAICQWERVPETRPACELRRHQAEARAIERHQSSLLRLHCALNV